MLWTDERLQQVIAQYTPLLYLHEDERYLPCSVDWYIQRSQLWLEEPIEDVSKLYVSCHVPVTFGLFWYSFWSLLGPCTVHAVGSRLLCCTMFIATTGD